MNAVICARYPYGKEQKKVQLKECREYAKKNNITVIHEYIDSGFSGTEVATERPEFSQMISDSSKRLFEAVLVCEPGRISRHKDEYLLYRDILSENGVKILPVEETILGIPMEKYMDFVLDGMA